MKSKISLKTVFALCSMFFVLNNINAQTTPKLIAIDAVQKIELKVNQSKQEVELLPINEKEAMENYLNQIDDISKAIHLKVNDYAEMFDISDISVALKNAESSFANINSHTSASLSGINMRLVEINNSFNDKIADYNLWGGNLGQYYGDYTNVDNNYNYIRTRTYTTADGLQYLDQIQYFDGLGRPVQLVQRQITSNDRKDLVFVVEYEGLSRKKITYLPVKVEQNTGYYVRNFAYITAKSTMYSDSRPFTECSYENSAMNRVVEIKGTGEEWKTHPATMQYTTNAANEVKKFKIDNNGLVADSYYPANTLYKRVLADEDGKTKTEYKNKLGQVIMTMQGNDNKTCYVYDDFGNLRYVLPPLATDKLGSGTIEDNNSTLAEYAYIYKYDKYGRMISKKLPGVMVEPIYMVYDKAHRLVLSQDGNQRQSENEITKWTYTKYDVLGRVLYSGICETARSHQDLRDDFENIIVTETRTNSDFGYTQTPMAEISYSELLLVNYYDDYGFLNLSMLSNCRTGLTYQAKQGYDSPSPLTPSGGNSPLTPTGGTGSPFEGDGGFNAKGLLTGTVSYLLDNSGNYLVTSMYYDKRERVVQTRATNYLQGFDIVYNKYNFVGNIEQTLKEHSNSPLTPTGGNSPLTPSGGTGSSNSQGSSTESPLEGVGGYISELYKHTYDHAQRLTKTEYSLNGSNLITLAQNTYDNLGRLVTKKRHNQTDIETFAYNIKNRLTKIQSGNFVQNISYEGLYNGNIAAISTPNLDYTYQYDELNRLLSGVTPNGFNETFSYDKHGNIETLVRTSAGVEIDNLEMDDYNGNQLMHITERANNHTLTNINSLKEYSQKEEGSFDYDANGNLIFDSDRKISLIEYNLLNLPSKIFFTTGNIIENVYAADGRKVSSYYLTAVTPIIAPIVQTLLNSKVINQMPTKGATATTEVENETHYVGNFEYSIYGDDVSLKIYNPEGYFLDGDLYYYRKDLLGNNREVVKFPSGGGAGVVVQKNDYYPTGLPVYFANTLDEEPPQKSNKRKYSNKEFIESGLDEYDSEARYYYPAIARTTTPDPLSEKYYSISPYAWCANNFINFIDPTGMKIDSLKQEEWNEKFKDLTDKRDDLEKTKSGMEKTAAEKGWTKGTTKKYNEVCDRIKLLNKTLDIMKAAEKNENQVYSLKQISGDRGRLTLDTKTKVITINYSSTAKFVHEVTHVGQFERNEIAFNGDGEGVAYDLWDEAEAYQAEYAYEPFGNNGNVKSLADITPSWVKWLTDENGNARYKHIGQVQIDIYSNLETIKKAYPELTKEGFFKGVNANFTLLSDPKLYYHKNK